MESRVTYAVYPERENLVRFVDGDAELYCPTKDGEDKWMPMPHLNEIRYGLGDAVWYDEISEEEAGEWMDRIKNG